MKLNLGCSSHLRSGGFRLTLFLARNVGPGQSLP